MNLSELISELQDMVVDGDDPEVYISGPTELSDFQINGVELVEELDDSQLVIEQSIALNASVKEK